MKAKKGDRPSPRELLDSVVQKRLEWLDLTFGLNFLKPGLLALYSISAQPSPATDMLAADGKAFCIDVGSAIFISSISSAGGELMIMSLE